MGDQGDLSERQGLWSTFYSSIVRRHTPMAPTRQTYLHVQLAGPSCAGEADGRHEQTITENSSRPGRSA